LPLPLFLPKEMSGIGTPVFILKSIVSILSASYIAKMTNVIAAMVSSTTTDHAMSFKSYFT